MDQNQLCLILRDRAFDKSDDSRLPKGFIFPEDFKELKRSCVNSTKV